MEGVKVRRMTVLTLGLLMVMAAIPAVSAAPPPTPFNGTWIGNDPAPPNGDGSTVHLIIEGGTQVRVTFTDELGSVCVNQGASVTFFTSFLTGSVSGDTLEATFRKAKCGSLVLQFLLGEPFTLWYDDMGNSDPGDDVLWDGSVLWSRDD